MDFVSLAVWNLNYLMSVGLEKMWNKAYYLNLNLMDFVSVALWILRNLTMAKSEKMWNKVHHLIQNVMDLFVVIWNVKYSMTTR